MLPEAVVKLAAYESDRWAGTTWWPHTEVGKEEIAREYAPLAACRLHLTVEWQEFQGLVGLAADEIVKIMAQRGQRP